MATTHYMKDTPTLSTATLAGPRAPELLRAFKRGIAKIQTCQARHTGSATCSPLLLRGT